MPWVKRALKRALQTVGYDLVRFRPLAVPDDADPADVETIGAVRPYTMTSPARVLALCEAVRYIVRCSVPGDIVECGVWRGGSAMAAARTLLHLGDHERGIFLYDTFKGMPAPDGRDIDSAGRRAASILADAPKTADSMIWCVAGRNDVERALESTGYPWGQVRIVEGKVEDTIPGVLPQQIALLRLDTDWYASTRHELKHLFPLLSPGGVLIVDDYGHWKGARQAVDEYLTAIGARVMLHRIDYCGRIAIKLNA